MIHIETVKTLKPGDKLYRVATERTEPEQWVCRSITVKSVGSSMIMAEWDRTYSVFCGLKRKRFDWISANCSLTERNAWLHCVGKCEGAIREASDRLERVRQVGDYIKEKIREMHG